MKRDIYHKLIEWKNNPGRKPLMLYGARQVGKTYILCEFGRNEFANMVYINCYRNPSVQTIFSRDVNINRILIELSALTGQTITESTLVFFDEVQEIPEVVAALKYFYEDAPQLCIAVAGSLLGVMNMENNSFPTGKIDILHLFPMTYVEFLSAIGEEAKARLLKSFDSFDSINALAETYIDTLRLYYYIGGMPEAVITYINSRDLNRVRVIQNNIIEAYEADISKHTGTEAVKARKIFQAIPSQLAKENKKFIYGALRKGARAAEYENAIQWLVDAGLVYKVCRVTQPSLPLKFYMEDNVFKLYLLDIGLLGAMVEAPASLVLVGNNIFSEYKGAFTENYVMTQLVTLSNIVISYFSKENSTSEIDFLVQKEEHIIPIEVKAEVNVKSKSLRQFVTIDHIDKKFKGLRFSMQNYRDQGWMENVPLFAISSRFL